MNKFRPIQLVVTLVAIALASLVGSVLLDRHADWGDPRQVAANLIWIVFLLSVLSLIIVSARLVGRRKSSAVR